MAKLSKKWAGRVRQRQLKSGAHKREAFEAHKHRNALRLQELFRDAVAKAWENSRMENGEVDFNMMERELENSTILERMNITPKEAVDMVKGGMIAEILHKQHG